MYFQWFKLFFRSVLGLHFCNFGVFFAVIYRGGLCLGRCSEGWTEGTEPTDRTDRGQAPSYDCGCGCEHEHEHEHVHDKDRDKELEEETYGKSED